MQLSVKKQKYAVIGDPINHSLSPQMQNSAFNALGIDAEYSAIHVKEKDLAKFADYAKNELAGFNITVPHKENIIPFLDDISELCKVSGSVNTVTNLNGKLIGDSTDGYGLEMAIKEAFGIDIKGNSFLFLGCGGTVKAVSYHFFNEGAKELFIANRTISKAEDLANSILKNSGAQVKFTGIENHEELNDFMNSASVVIQSTSLGLNKDDPSPLPEELIRTDTCMFDTIYKNTTFLKNAEKYGVSHAGGSLMLVHQGAKSFSIWTGKNAPIDIMKNALQ